MLTIHHLALSQAQRVVWLCEELALPYVLVRYERDSNYMAPPALKALHPTSMSPVLSDGKLIMTESGAIIDYLVHRHGGSRLAVAPNMPEYPDYLFWYHYANGTFMPAALTDMLVTRLAPNGADSAVENLHSRYQLGFRHTDERLAAKPYFAGQEFTAADIMMVFPMTTMRLFAPMDLTPYPNVKAYLARIGERPAFQAALNKADPGAPVLLS